MFGAGKRVPSLSDLQSGVSRVWVTVHRVSGPPVPSQRRRPLEGSIPSPRGVLLCEWACVSLLLSPGNAGKMQYLFSGR